MKPERVYTADDYNRVRPGARDARPTWHLLAATIAVAVVAVAICAALGAVGALP